MAKSDLFRENGKEKKGSGWLGPIKNDKGQTMTEISVRSSIGGKQVSYPILVPTLTKKEIKTLQSTDFEGKPQAIPERIRDKARLHAEKQIKKGESPFRESGKNRFFINQARMKKTEKMSEGGGVKRDPKVGTGKKPKGSDRRLYTDENPKDTVRIKYATVQDAKETIKKVKNIAKSFARKIQILTVLEQRAKFAGKPEQARLARKAKESLRKKRTVTASKGIAVMAKQIPPGPEGAGLRALEKDEPDVVDKILKRPDKKKGEPFGKGGFAEGGIIKGFTKGRQF